MYDNEVVPSIAIGSALVHYDARTNFNVPEIRQTFVRLTPEELYALKAGDILYADVGSLRRGLYSVYGWVKVRITEARYVYAKRWKISYRGGRRSGSCSVEQDGFCADLSRPSEEDVMRILTAYPRARYT